MMALDVEVLSGKVQEQDPSCGAIGLGGGVRGRYTSSTVVLSLLLA